MKLRKSGFTLIELLAVIVILAIITLIATPVILGIINDVKEEANKRSVNNYIDAIQKTIVRKNLSEQFMPTECTIEDKIVICDGKKLNVEIDGEIPTSGIIKISNGLVSKGTELIFKEFKTKINEDGKIVIQKLGTEEDGPNHLAQTNVKAVTETTKTTGIVPETDENGNIVPGSEFKIKVSDNIKDENGEIVEYTFFVLSNDGNYVNLIAEQNIAPDGTYTSELQTGDEWYVTKSDNRYGPQTAYTYLSNATNNWTNIPIIERFNYLDIGNQNDSTYGYQSIVTQLDQATGKYITTITPYSSDYGNEVTYENMRARLPYVSEVSENTSCKVYKSSGLEGTCPLWMVNYLYKSNYYSINEGKINSTGTNYGYWLMFSYPGHSDHSRSVTYDGYVYCNVTSNATRGVRPVITILKTDLLRVMK